MGSRLTILESTSMPPLSAIGQKVWRAFVKFGCPVVDRSGSPAIYADPLTVTAAEINPLRVHWCATCGGKSDLDRIAENLVVVRY